MRTRSLVISVLACLLSLAAPALAGPVAPDPLPYQDNFSASALDTSYWTVLGEDPGLTVQQIEGEIRVSGTVQDSNWGKNGLRTPGFPAQDFIVSVDIFLASSGAINQSGNLRVYFDQGRYFGVGYNDLTDEFCAYYTDSNGYHTLPLSLPDPAWVTLFPRSLKIVFSSESATFQAYVDEHPLSSYTASSVPGPLVVQVHQESQVSGALLVDMRFDNFLLDRSYETWTCIPDGCLEQLHDIDMLSATDGWAVGERGAIWHWDGLRWSKEKSPVTTSLYTVDMLSPVEGWAAGLGTMLHWDGTNWIQVDSPAWPAITGLDTLASNEAWAVTQIGGIMHWDGSEWRMLHPGGDYDDRLNAIQMLALDDGWAVGTSIMHWDGSAWSVVSHPDIGPLEFNLNSLSMLYPSDGWAVGDNNLILHWDGISWQLVSSPVSGALLDIAMLSPTDGWIACSEGQVLRWEGEAWFPVSITPLSYDPVPALAFSSAADGWLLVNDWFRHWDGETWNEWLGPPDEQLNGVALPAPGIGWAVGNAGVIRRLQGQTWSRMDSFISTDLNAVVAPGVYTDQAWVAGDNGVLLHWDSSQWISSTLPTSADLLDLSFIAPDALWAVSGAGEIFAWDGQTWALQNIPNGHALLAIAMLDRQDGWAAGEYGNLWRWDGQTWSVIPTQSTEIIFTSLAALAADDVWTAGYIEWGRGGTTAHLQHWDGQTWQSYYYNDVGVYGLSMESPILGWAVGSGGAILRWNGLFWARADKPTVAWLTDVDVFPGQEGLAVGAGKQEIISFEYPRQRVYLPIVSQE